MKNSACYGCPIGYSRKTKVDVPGFEGEGEGPEYETIYAMGSNCMVDNLAAITKANYICNEMGMDTITMGLAYATSPIGGSHLRADPAYFELFGVPESMDPHQWEGKAKVTKAYQDLSAIIDSTGPCIFFAVRSGVSSSGDAGGMLPGLKAGILLFYFRLYPEDNSLSNALSWWK